jgi:hypothetical protein
MLRSSISVSDVDPQQILDLAPHSETEVPHLTPGIRAESSAGLDGNSDITVRDLPITSNGRKYVQMQEDGLPVMKLGDMNFANNAHRLRYGQRQPHRKEERETV